MKIETNKAFLGTFFYNTNEQFVVPSYQRRYSWKNQHTSALFKDIESLKDNDGHLFGMIILHSGSYNGGMMYPELVDGQQRLTTLTILLKSLQDAFFSFQREARVNDINRMLKCEGLDGIIKNKLRLGDLDDSDYDIIMEGGNPDEIKNKNLRDALDNFNNSLSNYGEDDLELFYHKLTKIAMIIRLDVSEAQDAYKLFETINNRGLKLSATDIIKNFLLGHASKIDDNTTLEQVKLIWTQIIIELDGINTDNFFRQYLCSVLKRKISFNSLITEFKSHYVKNVAESYLLGESEFYTDTTDESYDEEEDDGFEYHEDSEKNEKLIDKEEESYKKESIVDFLKHIRSACTVYKNMMNADFDEKWINIHIINLSRVQSFPSYIFLMHFFQKGYTKNTQSLVLKMIETFMLRRHISERRTGENDYIFSQLMHCLDEKTEEEMLYSFRKRLRDYYPGDAEFEEKLPTYQFKGKVEDRARYILEQLEYNMRGDTRETLISTSDDVHLEHIVPKTINTKKDKDQFGDWISYLGDKALVKHKKYVSRIGNLTLLAAPLNIKASNNPFTRKKSSYRQSDLLITKELATKSDFKFSHIDKRCEEITSKSLNIWNIDFSDIEED